jgi:prepilin-type N-terminal cleavage/methylation domain-containing protein
MTMNMIRPSVRKSRGGFTLVEVLICAVLVALGFAALVAAFSHDAVVTQRGEEVSTATFLADEIRDMAFRMSLADALDLNGTVYSPAVLSTGVAAGQTGWSQAVSISPVSTADLNVDVAESGAQAARLSVDVRYLGVSVVRQTYFLFDMSDVPFTDSGG